MPFAALVVSRVEKGKQPPFERAAKTAMSSRGFRFQLMQEGEAEGNVQRSVYAEASIPIA